MTPLYVSSFFHTLVTRASPTILSKTYPLLLSLGSYQFACYLNFVVNLSFPTTLPKIDYPYPLQMRMPCGTRLSSSVSFFFLARRGRARETTGPQGVACPGRADAGGEGRHPYQAAGAGRARAEAGRLHRRAAPRRDAGEGPHLRRGGTPRRDTEASRPRRVGPRDAEEGPFREVAAGEGLHQSASSTAAREEGDRRDALESPVLTRRRQRRKK